MVTPRLSRNAEAGPDAVLVGAPLLLASLVVVRQAESGHVVGGCAPILRPAVGVRKAGIRPDGLVGHSPRIVKHPLHNGGVV